jgi:hypothetical protein
MMTTISSHTPGSFCWVELATTDQAGAKNFYAQLFGWTPTDNPMGPDEVYTIFKLKDRDAAAAYTLRADQRQRGVPVHWSLYIAVADCDAAAKKATELGGTVLMQPLDVGSAGRMAVIQDPVGAVFSLWQPKGTPGIGVHNEEGAFCWADLLTQDRKKAEVFYSALFGWTVEKEGDGYFHIKHGEHPIGGMPPSETLPPGTHNQWSVYFHSENCIAKTEQAKALGARVYMKATRIETVGTMSVVEDPQGATFCIFQKE